MSDQNKYNNKFDLEERTTRFAVNVVKFCRELKLDTINIPIINQLIRSAGSIGANYREANDALGKKDFTHRLKISRKEAKETIHWLKVLLSANPNKKNEINNFINEACELRNILSAIINKI